MVLYEIAHFIPSAVVNCDIINVGVSLSILVSIYRQIIILSKYNICINLCLELLIFLDLFVCVCVCYFVGFLCVLLLLNIVSLFQKLFKSIVKWSFSVKSDSCPGRCTLH